MKRKIEKGGKWKRKIEKGGKCKRKRKNVRKMRKGEVKG
jgi:hypothetical protein